MNSARPGRRYEILAQRGGRWLIDSLAASEVDALARAEAIYADDGVGAVRVVRAHCNGIGESVLETQILERVRETLRGRAPLRLAAPPDEEAWCETLADFYGPSSRHAIARLLRNFLDRFQITPTELLYNRRWIKQLDNQESLLPSAVQRMAAIQAERRKTDRRVRADAIDKFVDEATGQARDALASRDAPTLGADGLSALAATVAEFVKNPAEQGFWLRYAVVRAFEDMNSFAAKFERVSGWAADAPPALLPLIDELAAGIMGAASMIRDTLGDQPHLGGALAMLADLAAGRQEPDLPGAPAGFAAFAALMSKAAMPETRSVLYERLQRELATDKPLSREPATTQRRQLESLIDKLADDSGIFAGGPAMVAAIARRSRRFDIVGGVEDMRFATSEPAERIEELLAAEKMTAARRQQQAIGTYLREAIDKLDGEPAELTRLSNRIADTGLPEAMKKALQARIPAPTSAP
jgi:hypothetical protein